MYTYAPMQWLLLFYAYSFFGWCFETAYVSLLERRFVNRGFVRGPMLPLYGTGAVMILFVALPLKNQPILLFFAGMLAATVLEYVTGWAMESLFKVKYWDYSAHKFQFQGRICLQSSIAWGALSLLLVQVIQPPIERAVLALPPFTGLILAVCVSVVFAADLGYAFRTALDLAHVLAELTHLREQMSEMREQLAEAASETRERLTDSVQETREKLTDAVQESREQLAETREKIIDVVQESREQLTEAREWLGDAVQETREKLTENVSERRGKLEARLEELSAAYEARIFLIGKTRRWLVRGHPSAVSAKFGEALSELKEKFGKEKK